ncbi:MAG: hypothetical protein JWL65_6108 [Gammaproteobacteria bacterium]|nr:hypothetical protein [Gammaproteobacteria bacterium]
MIWASLDIFGYRNEIYFYMFFNEPESGNLLPAGINFTDSTQRIHLRVVGAP